MRNARTLAICVFAAALFGQRLDGQSLSQYRNFELGANVASVTTLTGMSPAEVKIIHQRPALMQDLEWRPSRWTVGSTSASTDPVDQILFSFYDNQLFRVVVDYGRDRTEGMTDADMIEAITVAYGPPLARSSRVSARVASRLEIESGSSVARWGDPTHAVVLYHTASYGAGFRLIVTETRLEDLARKAEIQAKRLDNEEAPRREIARQKKAQEDGLAAGAKARIVNKGVFRP